MERVDRLLDDDDSVCDSAGVETCESSVVLATRLVARGWTGAASNLLPSALIDASWRRVRSVCAYISTSRLRDCSDMVARSVGVCASSVVVVCICGGAE